MGSPDPPSSPGPRSTPSAKSARSAPSQRSASPPPPLPPSQRSASQPPSPSQRSASQPPPPSQRSAQTPAPPSSRSASQPPSALSDVRQAPSSRSSLRVAPSSRSSLRVLLGLDQPTAPIVALLYPTDRQTFQGGTDIMVEWRSSRGMLFHFVQLSLDDGRSYEDASPSLPGEARSFQLHLPNRATEYGRIKVIGQSGTGTRAFASSRAPFTIEPVAHNAGRVQLLAPLGGQILHAGDLVNVRWRGPGSEPAADGIVRSPSEWYFQMHLSMDGGESFTPVVNEIPGRITGLRWRVPNRATQRGRLRIVAIGPGEEISWDDAQTDFAIVPR